MGKGLVVTGTDTGVGKTAVGAALLRALGELGQPCRGFKPVETGTAGVGEDALALEEAAPGGPPTWLYTLPEPLAPEVAARRAGVGLEWSRIVAEVRARLELPGWTLVEGAGGLRVALSEGRDLAHLAADLDLPVVVVAANRLGMLNHALLTVEALTRRGLEVAAVVVNEPHPGPADLAQQTNVEELARLLPGVGLHPVPWVADPLARARGLLPLARALVARYT